MRFFKALWERFIEWRKLRAMDRVWNDFRNGRAYFAITVEVDGGTMKTFLNSKGESVKAFIPDGVGESEIDFGDPFLVESDDEQSDQLQADSRCGLLDGEGTAEGDSAIRQ